jgi:hypothetical protein
MNKSALRSSAFRLGLRVNGSMVIPLPNQPEIHEIKPHELESGEDRGEMFAGD